MTLSASNNNYTGTTTVLAGTLAATNSGAIPHTTTPTLSVTGGATLALSVGGTGWQAGDVASLVATNYSGFSAGSILGFDTTVAGTGGFSYGNALVGNMGVAKFGSNALTLSGSNTYAGGTIVNAGTLVAATSTGVAQLCEYRHHAGGQSRRDPGATCRRQWLDDRRREQFPFQCEPGRVQPPALPSPSIPAAAISLAEFRSAGTWA